MLLEKSPIIRNEYERLSGTPKGGPAWTQRLYLGHNHLLSLVRKGTHESVRRFYYADITAIRCKATRWGYLIDGAFVAVALVIWLAYLSSPNAGLGGLIFAVTATAMAATVLIVNALRGPICKTWLHTANHTEHLQSLSRFRTARYAIAELHERITEAQGSVDTVYGDASLPPFAPYRPPDASKFPTMVRPHQPRLMSAAFYLSFFAAACSAIRCIYEPEWMTTLTFCVFLAFAAICPVAILRSYGTDCPPKARRMACGIFAFSALALPAALLAMGFLYLSGANMNQIDSIPNMSPADGAAYFLLVGFELSAILTYTVCAWRGLAALRRVAAERPHED